MPNEHNTTEWIEQYLQGELSGDELEEFERKVATDPDFRREVDLQKNSVRRIRQVGRVDLLLELKAFHAEQLQEEVPLIVSKTEQKPPAKVIRLSPATLRIAATVALLIVSSILGYMLLRDTAVDPDELASKYFSPYPTIAYSPSRGTAPGESTKEIAFKAYESGDYPSSIRLFTQILQNESDELVLFYLGNAYMAQGQDAEAIKTFTQYLSTYSKFKPEAQWYLALSYLQENQTDEAQKLLDELAQGSSEYRDIAQQVLQELAGKN